jgi:hypothetical protein
MLEEILGCSAHDPAKKICQMLTISALRILLSVTAHSHATPCRRLSWSGTLVSYLTDACVCVSEQGALMQDGLAEEAEPDSPSMQKRITLIKGLIEIISLVKSSLAHACLSCFRTAIENRIAIF